MPSGVAKDPKMTTKTLKNDPFQLLLKNIKRMKYFYLIIEVIKDVASVKCKRYQTTKKSALNQAKYGQKWPKIAENSPK